MTKPHEPTEQTKTEVKSLVSFGVTHDEISNYLGIDKKTLYKYYREEIDKSSLKANAAVARVLYEKAVIERDTASVFFWLKTRAKWRETDKKDDKSATESVLELLHAMKEAKKD